MNYQGYLPSNGSESQRIKCIAYADDICAFVKDKVDFHRLHSHMEQYSSVSNSKFNEHKAEAFSLSGTKSPSWTSLLHNKHIKVYYHKHSLSAFRYLDSTCHIPFNNATPFRQCYSKSSDRRYKYIPKDSCPYVEEQPSLIPSFPPKYGIAFVFLFQPSAFSKTFALWFINTYGKRSFPVFHLISSPYHIFKEE
ncbi:hypothetical protein G6F62_012421 [Rhizopus arrhizus]|nr:hypothetical protein G6F62_012421 [Rhizopus arrhizus]